MRRLLPALALALAVTGCGTNPEATLRGNVEDVITAANGSSNSGEPVRRAVEELLGTISRQRAEGDLTPDRAAQLRELALAVQRAAASLEVAPTPSAGPSPPQQQPAPSPSPAPAPPPPAPSPSPSPEPPPEPSPSPEEEEEPSPTPPLDRVPTPRVTPLLAPVSPSPAGAAVAAPVAPAAAPVASAAPPSPLP